MPSLPLTVRVTVELTQDSVELDAALENVVDLAYSSTEMEPEKLRHAVQLISQGLAPHQLDGAREGSSALPHPTPSSSGERLDAAARAYQHSSSAIQDSRP